MKPCFYRSPGGGNSFQASLSSTARHLREGRIASVSWIILTASLAAAQPSPEPSSQAVERGEDFAVYRRVTTLTNATGQVSSLTNQFTLLENCLNYFENGQWKRAKT
jgi:hypothetical protein